MIIKVPFFKKYSDCTIGWTSYRQQQLLLYYGKIRTLWSCYRPSLFTGAHEIIQSQIHPIRSDVLKTTLPQTWHVPCGEKISGSAADNMVVYGYDVKSPQRQPQGLKSTVYNPLNSALLPVSQLCTSVSHVDSTCLLLSVVNVKDDGSFINTKF